MLSATARARIWTARALWALLAWAAVREAMEGARPLLTQLDHCEGLGCDYRVFFAPQVAALPYGELHPGWTSPPLLALAFAAQPGGFVGWYVLNLVGLGLLLAACRRRVGTLAVPLVLLSLPIWHALKWGQPSLLLAAAAVAVSTPEWLPRGRAGDLVRGATFGLVGGLKLYPALWALPDLYSRRRVIAFAAVLGVVCGVLLPWLVLPAELAAAMWGRVWLFQAQARDASLASGAWYGGQGLPVVALRWFADASVVPEQRGAAAAIVALPGAAREAVSALGALAGAAALWRVRREDVVVTTAVAMVGTTVLLNPGWHHYFAFLPWVQAVAWARADRPHTLALWIVSVVAGSAAIVGLADMPGLYVELTRWGATTIAALALVALFLVDRRRESPLRDIDGGGGSLPGRCRPQPTCEASSSRAPL